MRLEKLNVAELAELIPHCTGNLCLITADGDCINTSSPLYQVIGLANMFKVAQMQDVVIEFEDPQDKERFEGILGAAAIR